MRLVRTVGRVAARGAALGAFLTVLPGTVGAQSVQIVRDVRVQAISPTLVRIERRGPKGFEDRPTFTVVSRSGPGARLRTVQASDGTHVLGPGWEVRIPRRLIGLAGVRVLRRGSTVLTLGEQLPGPAFFPAPARFPAVIPLTDGPRMVPPPGGAVPANLDGAFPETSGFDVGNSAPDVYIFLSPTHADFRREFLRLTGPIPLVPRYTFGFWDSRWFPYTEASALEHIDDYQRRNIPLDMLVIDTDWRVGGSDGYDISPKHFPDLARFLARVRGKGVRTMFNDHPEPKAPTALDPRETRYRWIGLTSLLSKGMDVWWYDRNWHTSLREPMPGISKEVWGQALYHDIALAFRPNQRPLVMSNVEGIDNGIRNRAPHPAGHRYPIQWTGDTLSRWRYLVRGLENGVASGVDALLPYVNEDLGGHAGEPSPELYTRFLQFGLLSPIARIHCTYMQERRPWMFGPEAERIVTDMIRFRTTLAPTLVGASWAAHREGLPLMRRLDLEFPRFAEAAGNRQYLLGDDLLVAPVVTGSEGESAPIGRLVRNVRGAYYANRHLDGEPVLERAEKNGIFFNWGAGSPDPKVPSDHFSARFTGEFIPENRPRKIRLEIRADDGVALRVDGKLVINEWRPQDAVTNEAVIDVPAGASPRFELTYFEEAGNALLEASAAEPAVGPLSIPVWIPPGAWQDLWAGRVERGPRRIEVDAPLAKTPLFVRQGALVFLGDVVPRVDQQIGRRMTLEAFPPPPGQPVARTFWEDDGISNEAMEGAVRQRVFRLERSREGVRLTLEPARGMFRDAPLTRPWKVRFHLNANERFLGCAVRGGEKGPVRRMQGRPATSIRDVWRSGPGEIVEVELPAAEEGKRITVDLQTTSD